MSIKTAYFSLTAIAALGLMVSGCNKKHPVPTASTPKPAASQEVAADRTPARTTPADTGSNPTTSTTPAPSNGSRMSDSDRNTLNKSLAKLDDVLFDYDKATIRPDAAKTLEADLTVIRGLLDRYPNQKVKIEGHADERGSDEYNIALGDKRAVAAKEFLSGLGISTGQLEIVSFGKQRPVCGDHTEDCWQKNRRAHFVAEGAN